MTGTWQQRTESWSEEERDEYEERAAIIEMDGGLTRSKAELMAYLRVQRMHTRNTREHQRQTAHMQNGDGQ